MSESEHERLLVEHSFWRQVELTLKGLDTDANNLSLDVGVREGVFGEAITSAARAAREAEALRRTIASGAAKEGG